MRILGLSTMGASAAAISVDGEIVAAIEEERLTRLKNDGAFPLRSIRSCFDKTGVALQDMDAVCVFWQPWRLRTRAVHTLSSAVSDRRGALSTLRHVKKVIGLRDSVPGHPEMRGRWFDLFTLRAILSRHFGRFSCPIRYFDHHRCHAASAFNISPFDEALCLTYDGGGEEHSTVIWYLNGGTFEVLKRVPWPNSLGHYYSAFTGFLGFKMLEGEYKMMGLAPYGEPVFRDVIAEKILRKLPEGGYMLNRRVLNYHDALEGRFSPELTSLFGTERRPEAEFTQHHRDIAASIQAVFEDVLMHMMAWAKSKKPGVTHLCVAGGCALNVTANGRLTTAGMFDRIVVPPAPHDAGCAIGAAFLGERLFGTNGQRLRMATPYTGDIFTDADIEQAFVRLRLPVPPCKETDDLVQVAAECLARGELVAWFQGASEFGPRALGNRSFLADPRDDGIREVINVKIKKRELFRPFAPSVKAEVADQYFEIRQPSPFMNIVSRVRPDKRDVIPAVTHVDGTARVHTVERDANPLYWRLIDRFERLTGVGVLLNTSFNIQEPIVNTPEEAIATFLKSGVDKLVIGSFVCDDDWRQKASGAMPIGSP